MKRKKAPLTEENLAIIKEKLKDRAFAKTFAADPGAALASLGYYIPEKSWERLADEIGRSISTIANNIRDQMPEGKTKAVKVTVSLEDVPDN